MLKFGGYINIIIAFAHIIGLLWAEKKIRTFALLLLSKRIKRIIDFSNVGRRDMSINLGCSNIFMPKNFLNNSYISVFYETSEFVHHSFVLSHNLVR